MRKFCVIILVMAMAGFTHAGIITSALVQNGLDVVIDTTSQTISFIGIAPFDTAPMSVTGLALNLQLSGPGDIFYFDDGIHPCFAPGFKPEPGKWVGYSFVDINGKVGVLAVFSYTGLPTGVTLYDDEDWGPSEVGFRNGTIQGLGPIFLIPEPATLALLALGGLLVRRK